LGSIFIPPGKEFFKLVVAQESHLTSQRVEPFCHNLVAGIGTALQEVGEVEGAVLDLTFASEPLEQRAALDALPNVAYAPLFQPWQRSAERGRNAHSVRCHPLAPCWGQAPVVGLLALALLGHPYASDEAAVRRLLGIGERGADLVLVDHLGELVEVPPECTRHELEGADGHMLEVYGSFKATKVCDDEGQHLDVRQRGRRVGA
jgi:hypothetical protein